MDGLVRDTVDGRLKLVSSLKRQGRLTVVELEGWPVDFAAARANMLDHSGYVVLHSRGNFCRHRGLGLMDRLHMAYPAPQGRR